MGRERSRLVIDAQFELRLLCLDKAKGLFMDFNNAGALSSPGLYIRLPLAKVNDEERASHQR